MRAWQHIVFARMPSKIVVLGENVLAHAAHQKTLATQRFDEPVFVLVDVRFGDVLRFQVTHQFFCCGKQTQTVEADKVLVHLANVMEQMPVFEVRVAGGAQIDLFAYPLLQCWLLHFCCRQLH